MMREPVWLIQWLKSRSKRNGYGVAIPNFARVTETLYRGALPDAEGYRTLSDTLGVRRVCSLIERERSEDMKHALANGIEEWKHIPLSDRAAPAPDKVRAWLDFIRTAKTNGAIFTHCRGGRHRTGMLCAVYRVTDNGWTKEQAANEMLRFGWYGAMGHEPLLDWFLNEFDPQNYL